MVKVEFSNRLRDSIAIIGCRYVDGWGEQYSYIKGVGFILDGKYIITSRQDFLFSATKTERFSGLLFADILGKQTSISYVDDDKRRNLLVFEIADREAGLGIAIDSLVWNSSADDPDEEWLSEEEEEEDECVEFGNTYFDDIQIASSSPL